MAGLVRADYITNERDLILALLLNLELVSQFIGKYMVRIQLRL